MQSLSSNIWLFGNLGVQFLLSLLQACTRCCSGCNQSTAHSHWRAELVAQSTVLDWCMLWGIIIMGYKRSSCYAFLTNPSCLAYSLIFSTISLASMRCVKKSKNSPLDPTR